MSWWTRLNPSGSNLLTAVIATAICGVAFIAIWSHPNDPQREMSRYGESLARTIAETTTSHLLSSDRINLTVMALDLCEYDEIAGVVFYDVNDKIVAMGGVSDSSVHFTAAATLNDTITGFVSLHLNEAAFAPPLYASNWALSLLALLLTPLLTLAALKIMSRDKRSLPIVSVPEAPPAAEQKAFLLVVNLHNQLALDRSAQHRALEDALTMANEVAALYSGFPLILPERGVALVLDASSVDAPQAVYASFLTQKLLDDYETDGLFRCFLSTTTCRGNPAEVETLTFDDLGEEADFDFLLPLAALARVGTVLCDADIQTGLGGLAELAQTFDHPVLGTLAADTKVYLIEELPPHQEKLIDGQAEVILGYSTSSVSTF